jgi:Tfp pilus assembly protein PilF
VQNLSRSIVLVACVGMGLSGCTSTNNTGMSKLVPWTTPNNTTAAPTRTVSIFAKQPEASPELHVATARVYERTGNYEAAADEYDKALKKSPNDVATLLSYAHLLDHEGKLTDAAKMYQRAIKANPHEPAAYNDLGLCLARKGSIKDSAAALSKAVELQPDRPLYRNNLASVLVEEGRPDDALAQLKAVHPEAVAQYNVGVMLQQHKQDAQAEAHFRAALALDPTMKEAHEWSERLAARNPGSSQFAATQSSGTQMAAYQGPTAMPVRVASVPAPSDRPGFYGTAPEPGAVSNYLHPELSPTIDAARSANRYGMSSASDASGSAAGMSTGITGQSGVLAMPPTPDSVRSYQPTVMPQYLPPVQ